MAMPGGRRADCGGRRYEWVVLQFASARVDITKKVIDAMNAQK